MIISDREIAWLDRAVTRIYFQWFFTLRHVAIRRHEAYDYCAYVSRITNVPNTAHAPVFYDNARRVVRGCKQNVASEII